jgi:hypothetical protein
MNPQFFQPDPLNPAVYESITPRIVQTRQIRNNAELNVIFGLIAIFFLLVLTYLLIEKYNSLQAEAKYF